MAEEGGGAGVAAEVLGDGGADDHSVREPVKPEPITPKVLSIQLRAAAAFQIFDQEGNNTVDVRELGAIVRSLGLCPSEAELNQMITECEDEAEGGVVRYARFEPMITRVMMSNRCRSESEETILNAFQALDPEGKGEISEAELAKILLEEGEPFEQEEVDEMMAQAKALDGDVVPYEDHVALLHVPTRV